jgi:hypothetical protein
VSYVQAGHLDVELEAQLRQAQAEARACVSPADHLQVGLPARLASAEPWRSVGLGSTSW